MRRGLPFLLVACVACIHCGGDDPAPRAASSRVAAARAFLGQLGDEPFLLSGRSLGTQIERETFDWLRESMARSTDGDEILGFVVRRLDPLDSDSYAVRLHRRKGYPQLETGKRYVELHCLRVVSDPEIHGIVDVDAMKVVSILADGGA